MSFASRRGTLLSSANHYALTLIMAPTIAVSASMGMAQERSSQPSSALVIEDIVVTAQKRSQSVQDVSIAMTVKTGDELNRQGVANVQDIALAMPNTQINANFGAALFNVRGIGTDQFTVNLDSPVAIHVDEVYQSKVFMTGLLLFDIGRVEALKGPQGTVFGRNTTGGAVNFYTRKPTRELEAGGTLSYDDYETIRSEAYVSGPLTDTLSARISGMYVHQNEGFYENITRGDTEGRDRKYAVRGQLQWENDSTTALLTGHYGRDNSINAPSHTWGLYTPESLAAGTPVLCPEYLNGTLNGATASCVRGVDGDYPRSANPYISNGGTKNLMTGRSAGVTARIDHDLGSNVFTSISSYQYYMRDEQHDAEGGPINTIEIYNHNVIDQFTQEFRLTSSGNSTWNYVIGAFYEHDSYKNDDVMSIGDAAVVHYSDFTQKLHSIAIYTHNDVALTETLSLIAGVRYSRDRTTIDGGTFLGEGLIGGREGLVDGVVRRPEVILGTLATSELVENGGKRTDEDVSFKMGFEWRPDLGRSGIDEALIYGHVSTGYRAGGFYAEFTATQDAFTSLKPENLTAYEAGFKSSLLERRLQVNGALFRYDFTDGFLNVNLPNSVNSVVVNAGSIKSIGAELDVKWLAAQGLQFGVSGGWLDSRIKSDVSVGGDNLKNNRPVNAPEWSFAADVHYRMPLTSGLDFEFFANTNYRSSQYMSSANRPSNLQSGYWLVNGQIGIVDSEDTWRLAAWVKNLANTKYRTFVNDVPGYGVLNIYGTPRVFGATASFSF